jgi:hypothetical protein
MSTGMKGIAPARKNAEVQCRAIDALILRQTHGKQGARTISYQDHLKRCKEDHMKKAVITIAAVSLVVVILLTFFVLEPFRTVKKTKPVELTVLQQKPTQQEAATPADAVEEMENPACKIIIRPLVEESAPPLLALGPDRAGATNLVTSIEPKPPSPLQTISISRAIDIQPAIAKGDKAKQGLGLLTDTEETADNQILELQSMQVQPTAARNTKKNHKKNGLHKQ